MKYIKHIDGEIVLVAETNAGLDSSYIKADDYVEIGVDSHYVVADQIIEFTTEQRENRLRKPGPEYKWDLTEMGWVDTRPFPAVQAASWTAIKQARDTAISAPLLTPYGSFDADPRSQKNITDAIALLQALEASGTPQTIDFTLADNSVAVLTTAQMVEVGLLLGARTQEAYATARQLRADIEVASTQEEVEAVVWPT